jgi:hypothetical protein
MENYFSQKELLLLNKLVGEELVGIAGNGLEYFLSSDSLSLITPNFEISLLGDIFSSSFEGFEGQYSLIAVSILLPSKASTSDKQNFILRPPSSAKITNISIVRESIRATPLTLKKTMYSTDIGVTLESSDWHISITKLGHHDELLQVTLGNKLDLEQIPKTDNHFDDDGNAVEVVRDKLRLSDLL